MKRSLAIVLAVLAFPASALAKGPSAATITGPGLKHPLVLFGKESNQSSRLYRLVDAAGFFPATFGQSPDPMLKTRPAGTLGPRYTIVWVVPGPHGVVSRIRQELYPYAKPGALSRMIPGQPFWTTERTYGGWFRGGAELKQVLVGAGLPAAA